MATINLDVSTSCSGGGAVGGGSIGAARDHTKHVFIRQSARQALTNRMQLDGADSLRGQTKRGRLLARPNILFVQTEGTANFVR